MNPFDLQVVDAPPGEHRESARWNPRLARFQWVDIAQGEVFALDPVTGDLWTHRLEPPVTAILPGRARDVIARRDRLDVLDWQTGSTRTIASLPVPSTSRLNDGAGDPHGTIWIGSMAVDGSDGGGQLYRVWPGGRFENLIDVVGISNGIAWSQDARTAWYVDSLTGRVDTLSLDDGGSIVSRMPHADLLDEGTPDGLTIDADGYLWVALWDGARVVRLDPGGTIAERVAVPAPRPTSVALGGDGLMLVTSARLGLSPDELEQFPLSGEVFLGRTSAVAAPVREHDF
ncbi:N/A [soil metagenome]